MSRSSQPICALFAALALPLAAHAAPSLQFTPVVEPTGIKFTAAVLGHAFCDVSQRAIVLLQDGSVIAVDASGVQTPLGNVGRASFRNAIVCDSADRVHVTRGAEVTTLDKITGTTTVKLGIEPTIARALDDGTIGFVDQKGVFVRWDGTQVLDTWSTGFVGKSMFVKFMPSANGKSIAAIENGAVTVYDATGGKVTGPRANAAAWDPDGKSLLFTSLSGLSRWAPADPPGQVTIVDANARGFYLHVAGRRAIVHGVTGALAVEIGGATTQLTRWPWGFTKLAAGSASFALLVDREHGIVVDLAQSSHVVDEAHPIQSIRTLAFSPDGKTIAFAGGERDLMLAHVKSGAVERFQNPGKYGMTPQHLRWLADGSLVEASSMYMVKWSHDRVPTETRMPSSVIGLDDRGHPIDASSITCPLPATTAYKPMTNRPYLGDVFGKYLAVRCNSGLVFAREGKTIATAKDFVSAFAIAGTKQPRVVFGRGGKLVVADAKGERELFAATGMITHIAASRDRRYIAVATMRDIWIWDIDTEKQVAVAAYPRETTTALAWAPNGKQLAVASGYAVDLVTIKR